MSETQRQPLIGRYVPQSPKPDSPPATPPPSSPTKASYATTLYHVMFLPESFSPEGTPDTDSDLSTFVTPSSSARPSVAEATPSDYDKMSGAGSLYGRNETNLGRVALRGEDCPGQVSTWNHLGRFIQMVFDPPRSPTCAKTSTHLPETVHSSPLPRILRLFVFVLQLERGS